MEQDKIILYYGTNNPELERSIKIDPKHNGGRYFEFGNGFYLAQDIEIAIDYALRAELDDNKKISDDEIEKTLTGERLYNKSSIIHKYSLNLNEFKVACDIEAECYNYKNYICNKKGIRECLSKNSYKSILKDTLYGYINDRDYRPNCQLTKGIICGKYWDEEAEKFIKNNGIISKDIDDFVNICYEKGICKENKDIIQFCIHYERDFLEEHNYIFLDENNFKDNNSLYICKIKKILLESKGGE